MLFEAFLSQCLSRQSSPWNVLRYLCIYLLGGTDQCLMLKYESHQGLLHYNPEDLAIVTGQSIELHDVQ